MTWWQAGILANIAIMVVEYLNRTGQYATYWHALMHTGVFIVIAQYGLYVAWSKAPNLMVAWALFTVGNSALRVLNVHFFVGEPIAWRVWVGLLVMLGGMWFIKTGG